MDPHISDTGGGPLGVLFGTMLSGTGTGSDGIPTVRRAPILAALIDQRQGLDPLRRSLEEAEMAHVITRVSLDDSTLFERAIRQFMGAGDGYAYASSPGAIAFVAEAETGIVGWCWGYHLIRPDATSMLYLHHLEVTESHRRHGIGRALLRAFMVAGTANGASRMFLTTGADNGPARTLYDSMGGGPASQGPTVNYWFHLDRENEPAN